MTPMDHTEPQREHDFEFGRRSGDTQWTIERKLLIWTLLVSVLGASFGAGVNWWRLENNLSRTQNLEEFNRTELPTIYMRRDVYLSEYRALTDSINRLNKTLEDMEQERTPRRIRRQPTEDRP
jgi:hypothetical protein